jgi:hypothetical protein
VVLRAVSAAGGTAHVDARLLTGEVYHGVGGQEQPLSQLIAEANPEQGGHLDPMGPQVLPDHADVQAGKRSHRGADVKGHDMID